MVCPYAQFVAGLIQPAAISFQLPLFISLLWHAWHVLQVVIDAPGRPISLPCPFERIKCISDPGVYFQWAVVSLDNAAIPVLKSVKACDLML